MPEMDLRQPGFAYSACRAFTKNKKRIQTFKETEEWQYIYQNKLDKACFQHDMAYGYFKDLTRRMASDKILRDKAFNIFKYPKYDGYQRGLSSMVCNFLIKNPLCFQINLLPVVLLKMKICKTKNKLKNYINQLLENLENEKYTYRLEIILGVLILLICN